MPQPVRTETGPRRDDDDERGVVRRVKLVTFAIYWVVILYILGAGLVSVVQQVFWPASSLGIAPEATPDCSESLEASRNALTAIVATRIVDLGPDTETKTLDAFRAWDHHFYALSRDCSGQPLYAELARLRYRWEERIFQLASELGSIDGPRADPQP